MAVVVKNGKIVDIFTDASTFPDNPNKEGIPTVKEGIYKFNSGVHKPTHPRGYAALRVTGTTATWGIDRTEREVEGINIHFGYNTDSTSTGCLVIYRDSYNRFADAVGFRKEGIEIETGVKEYIPLSGYVIVDRTFDPNWQNRPVK